MRSLCQGGKEVRFRVVHHRTSKLKQSWPRTIPLFLSLSILVKKCKSGAQGGFAEAWLLLSSQPAGAPAMYEEEKMDGRDAMERSTECNWTMEPLQRSIARALALTLQRWCDPYSKTLLSRISKTIPAAERLITAYSQSYRGAISRHAAQWRNGSTAPRVWGFISHQLRSTGPGRAFSTEAAGGCGL